MFYVSNQLNIYIDRFSDSILIDQIVKTTLEH